MCSICSKNDFQQGKDALEKLGIWDLFVFPHIAWSAKGQAIAQMIDEMGLRDENVLFLDDNHLNLEEAVFFSKNLMVVDASKGDLTELMKLDSSGNACSLGVFGGNDALALNPACRAFRLGRHEMLPKAFGPPVSGGRWRAFRPPPFAQAPCRCLTNQESRRML